MFEDQPLIRRENIIFATSSSAEFFSWHHLFRPFGVVDVRLVFFQEG